MGRFDRYKKKSDKLSARAQEKRDKVAEIRDYVEQARKDAREMSDFESLQTEAGNYELAYNAGKMVAKDNKRANKAERRAAEIEEKAGKLEERAAAKYVKGMRSNGLGRVVGAVALTGATVLAAGLLAVEGANYAMNNQDVERWLFKNDWGTWLDTRDFTRDERVKRIYGAIDERFAGPVCDGAEKVGEALAPVGEAIGSGVDAIKDALTPNIEVKIVTADSMEK